MFCPRIKSISLSRSYLTTHDTEIDRLDHVRESLAVARGTRTVESLFKFSCADFAILQNKADAAFYDHKYHGDLDDYGVTRVSLRSRNRRPEKAPRESPCVHPISKIMLTQSSDMLSGSLSL